MSDKAWRCGNCCAMNPEWAGVCLKCCPEAQPAASVPQECCCKVLRKQLTTNAGTWHICEQCSNGYFLPYAAPAVAQPASVPREPRKCKECGVYEYTPTCCHNCGLAWNDAAPGAKP